MRAYTWVLLPCLAVLPLVGCAEGEDSEQGPAVGGSGAATGTGGTSTGGTGATGGSAGDAGTGGTGETGGNAGTGGSGAEGGTGGTGGSAGASGTGGAGGTGGSAGASGTGGSTGGTGGSTGGTGGTGGSTGGTGGSTGGTGGSTGGTGGSTGGTGGSTGGTGGTGGSTGGTGGSTGGTGGSTGGTGGSTGGTGGSTGGTGGSTGGTGGSTGGTGGSTYAHTITIDGINDFNADETFSTTTSSFDGYVTWDATNLYVGLEGSDVGGTSSTTFFIIYIGGSPGTTQGLTYVSQGPTLPFDAKWQIHWKANNTDTRAYTWNGSDWVSDAWDFTGKVYQTGTFIEMAIPLANIGSPTSVDVHLSMVNESGSGWTFAGVPSTSFTDGIDPDYTKYFAFDLDGSTVPNAYSPVP